MGQDSLEDFRKFTTNRFEAIIVAAKHARKVNEILIKKEEESQSEEVKPRMEKIVSLALQEVLEGKIKFDRPKNTGRKHPK
ncbi:MAG TPA: DNA-directed RNA polymerase subunit omega [candidate division Zixibacteria bacterium]